MKPAPAPPAPPAPFEVWALLAYVIGALFAGLLVYLGLRPGGMGPIHAWGVGRDLVNLCALAVLGTGLIWSFLHRPIFRPGRRLPFLILVLIVGIGAYPIPYPSSYEGHPSSICFRLPFEGEWTVFWGGEKKEDNLLAAYTADRRFGLDFVVAKEGKTHQDPMRVPLLSHCYGKEVLAPADGLVVAAVDRYQDESKQEDPSGNRVVIQVAERQFVFLCHLQKGSIAVKEGQSVKAGDPIGRVGSSGWSKLTPEPHLAVHLQDTPVAGKGEAIPWQFCDYLADGVRVEKGVPRGGIGPGGTLRGQKVAPSPR
jgi:hypothetical protein